MTADRNNPSNTAQDSDDLIAELARLVAQDARTTSGNSDVYARAEPTLEPEPQPEPEAAAENFQPDASDWSLPGDGNDPGGHAEPEAEPEYFDAYGQGQPDMPGGFEPDPYPPVEQSEDVDPIAGLIADAEVEAYSRDSGEDGIAEQDIDRQWDEKQPDMGAAQYQFETPAEPAFQPQPEQGGQASPLDDIEALIGDAARGDSHADAGMSGRRVRSSYLDDGPTDAAVDAAEAAIMAAAAASGGVSGRGRAEPEAEWTSDPQTDAAQPVSDEPNFGAGAVEQPEDQSYGEPRDYDALQDPLFAQPRQPEREPGGEAEVYDEADYHDEPRRQPLLASGRLKSLLLPVAGGVAILALLGGGYALFFSGPQAPDEAPVLTADASPIKEEGAPPADNANASVVFNEIEGNTTAVEDEALVSRDQTGGATGNDVASVIGVEEGEMALANRPVRTVTVRPDGTIVPAEDSVAGATVLPVDRPDVPPVPNSTLTSDPIGAAIAEAMAADGEMATDAGDLETLTVADAEDASGAVDAATGNDIAADVAAPQTNTTSAPLPIARPSGLGTTTTTTASAPETPAVAPPAAPSTPAAATEAAPAASGTVGAWVQLASQRTEADAQADIAPLQSRFGSLFNGATPEVSRVDLGERGIYYRVRLPQPTFAQANSVCSAIQGQGGDCFVLNN